MAGSYLHVTGPDLSFIGTDLIDNLGDAYEALEECHAMITYLTGNDRSKIHEAWLEGYFKKNYPPSNLDMATFDRFWSNHSGVTASITWCEQRG